MNERAGRSFRRVVTGQKNGKAAILSDGRVPTEYWFKNVPGMASAIMWCTDPTPALDVEEAAPAGTNLHPPVGHTRLVMVEFPPDAVMGQPDFDLGAAVGEQVQMLPGLGERFEPDNPGMHCTDTVDYGIVLDGEIVLDLGDGEEVLLKPGDVVVQQQTRHAWRNRSPRPARLAVVLIGTDAAR